MFDYENRPEELMTSDVMGMVSAIHEHRGKQELYRATRPEVLDKLCEVAMIQSTAASNRIENIKTSDKRLRDILAERIEPKNRDEREIAGYRYVLDMIHTQHEHIDLCQDFGHKSERIYAAFRMVEHTGLVLVKKSSITCAGIL
ncbi:MAG: hypothetical protein RR477_08000 [Raoultibacter sp.]